VVGLLNANNVPSEVETFGTSLHRPTAILQRGLFAAGVQVNF